MTSNPQDPKANAGWLRRSVQMALRAVAASAAVLGVSLKLGSPDAAAAPAQTNVPPQSGRLDPQQPAAGDTSSALDTLLQGTWSTPPQLAARNPQAGGGIPNDKDLGKTKFDDLGFISHIDSGFHDFADR